jgi:hypothetical protein
MSDSTTTPGGSDPGSAAGELPQGAAEHETSSGRSTVAATKRTAREQYRAELRIAEQLRNGVPTAELLGMAQNGFLLAQDELRAVVMRLGERQRDMEDLLSIAKSMEVLSKKLSKLGARLAPEVLGEADDAR